MTVQRIHFRPSAPTGPQAWMLVMMAIFLGCGIAPPASNEVAVVAAAPSVSTRFATSSKQEGPWENRLAKAASPYLAMHGQDPVNWYPWGDEAFDEARRRNVPVFLSIGYYACHWCHVMHKESFKDPKVAAFLNEHFVAIKVDREERPDVDALYMDAVHMINNHGGWPASVWLTPDRLPFFAGTYFPPASRQGRMGFLDLLQQIATDWKQKAPDIGQYAQRLRKRMAQRAAPKGGATIPDDVATEATRVLVTRWDSTVRGWGIRRQFPMTANLEFLLRYGTIHKDKAALAVVQGQLDAMDRGGIHDHLGGGFHRYTVDREWQIPHFEKMLYDNGQLLCVYAEAAVVLGNARFGEVARDIAEYLLREMRSESGAFHSSQSADSEGEEGTFYVWTTQQVGAVLSQPEPFLSAYGLTAKGNFEGGRNVLHRVSGNPESPELLQARRALRSARSKRPHPPTDKKLVVAWNGLTIGALARAGRLLHEPRYVQAAQEAARAVLHHLRPDGGVPRTLDPGSPRGVLEDYAFLSEGLLDLWETDHDPTWLIAANDIATEMTKRFYEPTTGTLYQSEKAAALVIRRSEATDGAEPSGPGRALSTLIRLRSLGGSAGDAEVIDKGLQNAHWVLDRSPDNATSLSDVADRVQRGSREVVIATSSSTSEGLTDMLAVYNETIRPDTVLAVVSSQTAPDLSAFTATIGKEAGDSSPRAYVCRNGTCRQPTDSADGLRAELARSWGQP